MTRRKLTIGICVVIGAILVLFLVLFAPGIPAGGSSRRADFNLAFWSNVYSSLVSSLITGVVAGFIVALVMWRLQISAEERQERARHEEEIQKFYRYTHAVLNSYYGLSLISARSTSPDNAEQIADALTTVNINHWHRALPEWHPFLDQVGEFTIMLTPFEVAATTLDVRLEHITRAYVHFKLGLDDSHDQYYRSYFVGRILGLEPKSVLALLPRMELPNLEEMYDLFMHEERMQIAHLVQEFLTTRERLSIAVRKLKEEANKPPPGKE